jgi:rhodanese-related sulfurtransferase
MTIRAAFTAGLALVLGVTLTACAPKADTPAASGDPVLSTLSADAQKALSPEGDPLVPVRYIMEAYKAGADIVFVDARTPLDYDYGHIPGAINVPFFEAEKHISQLAKDRLYITYCECPHAEAVQVADVMRAAGFTNVKTIDEGLYGWQEAGGELVDSQGTPALAAPDATVTAVIAPATPSESTPGTTPPALATSATPGGG